MTLTITPAMLQAAGAADCGARNSARERMLRDLERIEQFKKQMGVVRLAERIQQQSAGIVNAIKESQRRLVEQVERFRHAMEIIDRIRRQIPVLRTDERTLHRGQDGSTGKGKKSSAKKGAKSAGGGDGGGGDGDGDGDGPQRTPSKQKRRPSTTRSNPQRSPSIPPGAIANTSSPQLPAHRPSPGRDIAVNLAILCLFILALVHGFVVQLLVIPCLVVIALGAMDQPVLAKHIWSSVPKLLKQLTKPSGDES